MSYDIRYLSNVLCASSDVVKMKGDSREFLVWTQQGQELFSFTVLWVRVEGKQDTAKQKQVKNWIQTPKAQPYIEFRYKILMTMTSTILTVEDHFKGDKHLI